MFNAIQEIDFAILDWIQASMRSGVLDFLMPKISFIANNGGIWILLSLALIISKEFRKTGIKLATCLISEVLIVNVVLKDLISRPRPCWINDTVELIISEPQDFSFPSGHTAACFAGATILMMEDKRLGIPALIYAILMAFSRMYLYVHFPTDVLCGALIGVAIGLATEWAFKRFMPEDGGSKEDPAAGQAK